MIYADPSFLFSFYCHDANSPVAARTYQSDPRRPLFLTAWQRFEFRNAVRLTVHRLERSKIAIPFQPGNVFKAMQADLDAGRLQHAEVDWRASLRLAETLSDRHTVVAGAASVDVWHVAAAALLEADTFWTFDGNQRELALRCGQFKKLPKLI